MSGSMVDDSDSAVVYSGQWYSYSDWSSNYQRTVHVSSHLNDRAVLKFQGTGVLVNSGQQGVGSRVRASYAIDGGSPTVYVYSNVSYQSTSQAYRSPTLPDGQHTLTVTNLDSGDYSLYLDFFLFFTADETTSAPSSITSSTTTTLTSASSTRVSSNASGITPSGITSSAASGTRLLAASATGSSSGLSSSSMPSPSSPTNPNNTNQISLIVGPVIGAIVICSFIFFLLRRRQKKKGPDSPSTPSAFNNPVRFPPITHLANGQKPSSLLHDSSEPPPYVQDLRLPSDLLTPNRLPAKFRGG